MSYQLKARILIICIKIVLVRCFKVHSFDADGFPRYLSNLLESFRRSRHFVTFYTLMTKAGYELYDSLYDFDPLISLRILGKKCTRWSA